MSIRILKELCKIAFITSYSAMIGIFAGITYLWTQGFKCFFDNLHATPHDQSNFNTYQGNATQGETTYTAHLGDCVSTVGTATVIAIPIGLLLYYGGRCAANRFCASRRSSLTHPEENSDLTGDEYNSPFYEPSSREGTREFYSRSYPIPISNASSEEEQSEDYGTPLLRTNHSAPI